MKTKPYLVVYNTKKTSDYQCSDSDKFEICLFEQTSFNDELCQAINETIKDLRPIVVINANVQLPNHWAQRLLETINNKDKNIEDRQLCSALSSHIDELSPLVLGDKYQGLVSQLDNLLYLLQPAGVFHSNKINFECFIVRDKAILNKLNNVPYHACNNLLAQSNDNDWVELSNPIDIGNQQPLPAHALAGLQWKLKAYLNHTLENPCYPLLDDKPIMLHITMSWGGGVHQWINDYCQHETNFHHLILESNGEFFRHRHGENLTLHYANTSGIEIQKFDLQAPINVTSIKHTEYAQILNGIISRFQIQQIVVSSLIGHSMQCLQTDVPTLRVFHDYFPSWPSLIANLEKPAITVNDLDAALTQTKTQPFGLIAKGDYLQWRKHLHQIYKSGKIKLVAPNQSVIDNLTKIDAQCFQSTTVIPHAITPIKPIQYSGSTSTFQVLVLGRINPSKGQNLLEQLIEKLGNDYLFTFLGSGKNGEKYLKTRNITVITDYDNSELRQQLQDAQPDIALITSQTSETFNYTLSELQQAGICTVSTKYGALKNRIIDGETGFLCDDNVEDIVNIIKLLRSNPNKILTVRENLKNLSPVTFETVINQYKKIVSANHDSVYHLQENNKDSIFAQGLLDTFKEKNRVSNILAQTEITLEERTLWGQKLTEELSTAEKNINLEKKEAKRLELVVEKETARMTEEIHSINQILKSETNRMTAEIEHINHVLHIETIRMESEISQLNKDYESLNSQHEDNLAEKQDILVEKQTVFNELTDVYNSRSWRVTKPMRRFTTWARHKRNAIKFRLAQIKTFPSRAIRSLKTRGFSGTVSVIKGKISKPKIQHIENKVVEITQDFETIAIKANAKPIVSIIIPVYNHFEHTYNCLKSIAKLQDKTSFEVIVVDDCSTDDTQKLIKNISGVSYKRQKQNGGFIESCNTGAKLAKGQYLMFLNNDTVVYKNWLDALLDVFENYPDAGLVGSKLVYPDNQLQEAGGIVFSDASGWNYGRLGKPDEPWYNHVREVDYCSGASILISNKLFVELGYFDERYKPAYYEDTDLAFAVRNIGKKVYYQPASMITHFEGISSGTDLTAGMKKYQVVNQAKFKQKWASVLARQQKSGTDIELCRIHANPKRILIFDACTPTPDQDSGSLRMINLIKILKELNYHVIFMPENLSHNQAYTEALQQLGVECIYTPHITNPVDYLKQKGKFLDVVMLSRYYVAEPVMPFIREYCPKAQIIFDTVDLHYVRERRMAEIGNDKKLAKMAEITREKELAVAKACDVTLVVSPYEVEVLAKELPNTDVKVLTNIHEIYGCRKPFSDRKDIMFIGGYQHTPNVDAIEWFVAKIFPLIEKRLPDLKFHIIGSKAPKHIQEMARDNIIFQGFVEDIEPVMDDIRIAIAPLRYGAGVKGKVNMSMSYGQPVVGTKVAVEGMYAQEGVDVLMAETPQEFADQIIRLYNDEELWNTISQGGLANVQNYFSFEAAKQAINDILN